MKIKLPPMINNKESIEDDFNHIVVIGANGSGKTRFGSYIEENNKDKNSHRISAQKSLSIPDYVSTKSIDVAKYEFLYGYFDKNDYYKTKGWKKTRWNEKLNTHLLDDFEKLMVLLHTDEFEKKFEL